ncbi:MAG: TAXI family TRAP transporter solute-binding subunit [Rhodomicrobiaceae bacterium]
MFRKAYFGLFALALAAGTGQAQEKLLIGSTSASSSHYGYFVAVSQVINEKAEGIETSVVETGATVDNLRRLDRNQVDLGLVTTNTGFQAYKGTADYEGKPVDTRLLWVYVAAPQNVIVRTDSDVTKLEDLAGKPFNPGLRGSATEKTTEAVFKLLGIEIDAVRGSTTDVVDAIKDNRAIGYVKSGAGNRLDGSTMDIATFSKLNVLSLTAEQADKIRQGLPEIGIVDVPEGAGEGIPAYTTWSFGVATHARPDLDEETAYKITKAVMEDTTVQANAMAELKGADLAETTLKYGSVPLHAGAAKYFREKGYDIPEHLQPK